ncbi:GyrI-like domain-containing protein [Dyadobacter pollutisoli]|uniref:GyrI-like domain-containing protein n=1 Tax=Dyadobacter pollutisoli TaxID=2910158 RepID=A0A9E8N767_9BACT|nr:GyrI-like domain-containing protein [Dyadobacter pollutisoli]WAC11119.1 GyrI-like domain-containing protein [Dyadobacter pollutisoli]
MQLKTIQPIHVLYFETQTSFNEISEHIRHVAHALYRDAVKNDLEITGPVYWIYNGADGNPETVFTLTIALPVSPKPELANSEFRTKYLEKFECATDQLYGGWDGFREVYGQLIPAILSNNLTMSGENREIYINLDFENPDRNTTEIQIGILK